MKACFSRKRALKGFSKRARFVGHAHTISIEEAKDKTWENGLQSDCRRRQSKEFAELFIFSDAWGGLN